MNFNTIMMGRGGGVVEKRKGLDEMGRGLGRDFALFP